jgi:hypothetical protein
MELQDILKKLINKIEYNLKSSKELELALKAKLTKKELKLLKAMANNEVNLLKDKLNLNEESLKILEQKLIKKLNRNKVKQFLYKDNS